MERKYVVHIIEIDLLIVTDFVGSTIEDIQRINSELHGRIIYDCREKYELCC